MPRFYLFMYHVYNMYCVPKVDSHMVDAVAAMNYIYIDEN